mmetsp:Transcript_29548/g.68475  ORF Transcript_29548/g.68475 Transcript_29548/m.68475 type:complete len:307 (+) Transcript_29548:1315-2235(+)
MPLLPWLPRRLRLRLLLLRARLWPVGQMAARRRVRRRRPVRQTRRRLRHQRRQRRPSLCHRRPSPSVRKRWLRHSSTPRCTVPCKPRARPLGTPRLQTVRRSMPLLLRARHRTLPRRKTSSAPSPSPLRLQQLQTSQPSARPQRLRSLPKVLRRARGALSLRPLTDMPAPPSKALTAPEPPPTKLERARLQRVPQLTRRRPRLHVTRRQADTRVRRSGLGGRPSTPGTSRRRQRGGQRLRPRLLLPLHNLATPPCAPPGPSRLPTRPPRLLTRAQALLKRPVRAPSAVRAPATTSKPCSTPTARPR